VHDAPGAIQPRLDAPRPKKTIKQRIVGVPLFRRAKPLEYPVNEINTDLILEDPGAPDEVQLVRLTIRELFENVVCNELGGILPPGGRDYR
jgi:hypothetical protein